MFSLSLATSIVCNAIVSKVTEHRFERKRTLVEVDRLHNLLFEGNSASKRTHVELLDNEIETRVLTFHLLAIHVS